MLCIGILLLYFKYKYKKTPSHQKNEFEPQYEHSITKAVNRLQFSIFQILKIIIGKKYKLNDAYMLLLYDIITGIKLCLIAAIIDILTGIKCAYINICFYEFFNNTGILEDIIVVMMHNTV